MVMFVYHPIVSKLRFSVSKPLSIFIRRFLNNFGVAMTSSLYLENLRELDKKIRVLDRLQKSELNYWESASVTRFLLSMPEQHFEELWANVSKSKSQLAQDLFVLSHFDFKKSGYFVEFGATDGIKLSNTYLLEQDYGWHGILAEPARVWHDALLRNRPRSIVEQRCIWKDSNSILTFCESDYPELSTLSSFHSFDSHHRGQGQEYQVGTISLNALLEIHGAPKFIDYLSIDTEGSEYEILKNLDFETYTFGVITCEHNHSSNRKKIHRLLTKKGYIRKFENLSFFDDWYVRG